MIVVHFLVAELSQDRPWAAPVRLKNVAPTVAREASETLEHPHGRRPVAVIGSRSNAIPTALGCWLAQSAARAPIVQHRYR